MSKYDPTSSRSREAGEQYRPQPIELEREDRTRPELRWIALETPDQSYLLKEADDVLDSHFNTQLDIWEVLIRIGSDSSEE